MAITGRVRPRQLRGWPGPGGGPRAAARWTRIPGTLAPGFSVKWSAVLPVNEVGMSVFGVYPLAAEAGTSAVTLGTSRTFLPFWPTGKGAVQPRENIAWIWPLIDQPDQGPCAGLLNNDLAASMSSGGRLADLLNAGRSAAGQAAQLTWVIDPSLLASAQVMTRPPSYPTGGSASCAPVTTHAASGAAAAWLAGLRSAVAGQPAVATPYADVDIAALVQQNLDSDVHRAFTDGRTEAFGGPEAELHAPAAGRAAIHGGQPGHPRRTWTDRPGLARRRAGQLSDAGDAGRGRTASRPWC